MSRTKKIVLFLALALAFVLIAVSALVLFLPRLIDLEGVKTKATAAISEKTGAVVQFDQVGLAYFPRLRVTISGVNAQFPDGPAIHAESLSLYPSLLRLLSGKVQLASVQIQAPVISVRIKKPAEEEDIDAKLARLLAGISSEVPGLDVRIRRGVVNLAAEGGAELTVRDIEADADFGRMSADVSISGNSDFVKRIALAVNLKAGEKSVISADLSVNAKEIDIIRARDAVLPLAGDVPVARTIFSYLRAGSVPVLSIESKAGSVKELGKTDNIIVKGDLSKGSVSVPNTVLEFSKVNGRCSVEKGILQAEHVTAIMGSTGLHNAKLRVGVRRGDEPFRLETDIRSTIPEAAGITGKILKEPPAFLSHLGSINGPFEGHLVLGESTSIFRAGSGFRNGMLRLTAKMKTDFAAKITMDLGFRNGGGPAGTHIEAEARDVDIRRAASGLRALSDDLPALDKVFAYVPSGSAPVLTFSAKGATFDDLGMTDRFAIRGGLVQGTVVIPEVGLVFNNVDGSYSIEKGILSAADVKGVVDGGGLKNATVKIYLGKDDGPFRFDADTSLTAQAAQQLLRRFVKEPVFPLDRLRDLRGTVSGRISVGDSTAAFASWKENGVFGFDGRIDLSDGPAVDLSLKLTPRAVAIRKLQFRDAQSNAAISLNLAGKHLAGQYDGTLTADTLARVVTVPEVQTGSLRGSLSADIDLEAISKSTVSGGIAVSGMPVRLKEGLYLNIRSMDLRAAGGSVSIEAATVNIGDTDFSLRGTIRPGPKEIILDTDVSARLINYANLKQLQEQQKGVDQKEQSGGESPSVRGVVRVSAEKFVWDRYTVSPLVAVIDLDQKRTAITVNDSALCGVSMPGSIIFEKGVVDVAFRPAAKDRELLPAISCLSDQKSQVSGTFSLEGDLKARGKADELVRNLNGALSFSARNGSIDKAPTLARVLTFIDLSEIFSGSIPDVGKEQFPYRSITARGEIKNGKLTLRDAVMDAPAFNMVATGDIDYVSETMDVKLLAAPLSTIDSVLKRIPVVKQITGGSLVAVPVRVTGNFKDLKIQYIPLSAVGSGLLGIMERTIKLPVTIFQPSAPAGEK